MSLRLARRRRPARPGARRLAATAKRAARGGLTLTEVLMSLLVMGIGVTSVATLFPLAVLRGARATQLTAGTILKQNAAETVAFSFSPALAPPPATIGGVAIGTGAGEVNVLPVRADISRGVNRDAMLLDPDANGSAERFGPALAGSAGQPADNWAGDPVPPRKYVVDPLGAAVLAGDAGDAVTPYLFGAVDDATFANLPSANVIDQFAAPISGAIGGRVQRFCWPYPFEVLAAAEGGNAVVQNQMIENSFDLVGRPGDYGTEIDTVAVVSRPTATPDRLTIAFPPDEVGGLEDLFPQGADPSDTDAATLGTDTARAVLFRPDGRGSAAVWLRRLYNQKAAQDPPVLVDVIPAGGSTIQIALPDIEFLAAAGLGSAGDSATLRVRVERPDRRYSWMLTCRRTGTDRLETQVAVFFNRALSAEDESVWRCQPVTNAAGRIESYVLFWDPSASPPQLPPQVNGGTRLLEMGELQWLTVGAVAVDGGDAADAPVTPPDGTTAGRKYLQFSLSSDTPNLNEAGLGGPMFAAFPRGVVDVYPLSPPGAIRR